MKDKKRIVFILTGVLAVCVISFLLTSVYLSKAAIADTYQMDGSILMRYNGNESYITIPRSVTEIAPAAFEGNTSLKEVVIPQGITKIGYSAFAECPNLCKVEIAGSVTEIGSSAFANCPSLLEFSAGEGLCELGSGVFAGDELLNDVEFDKDNNCFVCLDSVIYSADRTHIYEMLPGRGKNFYIMNDNVTGISQYAFWGCNGLEHISLSSNLEQIDPYAFSNANDLKSLTMTFKTKKILMKAFEDCANLEQIYLPDTISYIHPTAFDGCKKLKYVVAPGSYAEYFVNKYNFKIWEENKYALDITAILAKEYATPKEEDENNIDTWEDLVDNKNVLGQTAIVNNNAVVLIDNTQVEVVSGPGVAWNDVLKDKSSDGRIPDNFFYLKSDLKTVQIPENVNAIGDFSFARSGLTEVDIPEGVTSIGTGAFYHCDSLTDVSIPGTVTEVGRNAFNNTPWYNDWLNNSEEDYLIVGDGCLIGYKGSKDSFELPAKVKNICCDTP